MYHWRTSHGPVDLAFTDRHGGDLAVRDELARVATDFAPGTRLVDMRQVHGRAVAVVGPAARAADDPEPPEADALVTTDPDVTLVVRVADCLPVLLADPEAGVVGVAHAGRAGLALGVVPATVAEMGRLGARRVTGWLGPHICGSCYEVPAAMRDEVAAEVPAAAATTSWGTPALDIGAGVRTQLDDLGVEVVEVTGCTLESADLYSFRREGAAAGRFAGLIRRRP